MKLKMTGERSIESKLARLAYDLEHDASRIRADYDDKHENLANALKAISRQLGKLSRGL